MVTQGSKCCLRLFDKENNKLYAECPIDTYPGSAVQTVSDSSRYFVILVKGAYVGMGFAERNDSFDLNVALQDHFKGASNNFERDIYSVLIDRFPSKGLRLEEQIAKEAEAPPEKLDLALKEGQTIKVNINIPSKKGRERSKSPMGAGRLGPPPSAVADEMAAAGIEVQKPKLQAPPAKQTNPNWIQF